MASNLTIFATDFKSFFVENSLKMMVLGDYMALKGIIFVEEVFLQQRYNFT